MGRTVEVYIDNIVVKSKTCMEHMLGRSIRPNVEV